MTVSNIQSTIKDLLIDPNHSFLIVCHRDPDFDAIGSVLALSQQLDRLNQKNIIWVPDSLDDNFSILPGVRSITHHYPKDFEYTHIISLDASDITRIHSFESLDRSKALINIDHHHDNTHFGQHNLVWNISSVGELLCTLFSEWEWPIDSTMATCLYSAILFDTGSFQHSNTTPKTHRIAATLLSTGINHSEIYRYVYENKSEGFFNYLSDAIKHLKVNRKLGFAHTIMDISDSQYDVTPFLNILKNIDVFLIFREVEPDVIKISLRSKGPFDVSSFARQFGGGGHKQAAGIRIGGKLSEISHTILKQLEDALGD